MQYTRGFQHYLSKKKLKKTDQRFLILEEIFSRHDHFQIKEILSAFRKKKISVSRATLYRTLQHLVASGMVRSIEGDKGQSLYEHCYGHPHHDHLLCVKCGNIFEFQSSTLEEIQERICREKGFQPLRHSHQIQGVCASCQNQMALSDLWKKKRK